MNNTIELSDEELEKLKEKILDVWFKIIESEVNELLLDRYNKWKEEWIEIWEENVLSTFWNMTYNIPNQ